MRCRLIVFDMDGTVLDTLADLHASCNHALAACGLPGRSIDEVRRFVGNGLRKLIERAVPEGSSAGTVEAVIAEMNAHYAQHCLDETKPYPGIPKALRRLREAGLMTAVVSNKPDYAVRSLTDRFFPGLMDGAAGAKEGIRIKPAPDSVFSLMERLGVSAEETVCVGDSEVDVETAANAGTGCLAVSWGFRSREELIRAGAEHIASSPEEMADVLLREAMGISLSIDPLLKKTYPRIRLGCLRFTAEVKPPDEIFGRYLQEEVLPRVKAETEGKAWGEIPGVRGSRRAYRAFGWEPSRHRVSSEALIRRIRRGDELYRVNTVVDVNNALSARCGLSLGCYDVSVLKGAVVYRRAEEGEAYEGIGRGLVRLGGLPVLCDEEGPFGSSLSDSVRASVTLDSREILVVMHCFDEETDLKGWLGYAAKSFEAFAGARGTVSLII